MLLQQLAALEPLKLLSYDVGDKNLITLNRLIKLSMALHSSLVTLYLIPSKVALNRVGNPNAVAELLRLDSVCDKIVKIPSCSHIFSVVVRISFHMLSSVDEQVYITI